MFKAVVKMSGSWPNPTLIPKWNEYFKDKNGQLFEATYIPLNTTANKQSAYYWACVVPFIQDLLKCPRGSVLNLIETNDYISLEFFNKKSINDLSKIDFIEILDVINEWSLKKFDRSIPKPNYLG